MMVSMLNGLTLIISVVTLMILGIVIVRALK